MKMIRMMLYGSGLAMKIRRRSTTIKKRSYATQRRGTNIMWEMGGRVVETAKGTMITMATYGTLHTHVCVCTSLRIPATWQ